MLLSLYMKQEQNIKKIKFSNTSFIYFDDVSGISTPIIKSILQSQDADLYKNYTQWDNQM